MDHCKLHSINDKGMGRVQGASYLKLLIASSKFIPDQKKILLSQNKFQKTERNYSFLYSVKLLMR